MCELSVSVDRTDIPVVVDDVLPVPIEREHSDTALEQLLVDDVRHIRQVLQVFSPLGQPQGEVPRELNGLGRTISRRRSFPSPFWTRLLGVLRFEAFLQAVLALRARTFSVSESTSL